MPNIIEITDFSAPELDIYARLSENQLRNLYQPKTGIFIAESPKVIHRALDAGYQPVSFLMEKPHVTGQASDLIARCSQVPVYTADFDVLTRLTGFQLTRGVLCAMYRLPLPGVKDICANARRIAVLEHVMNPTNLGAIFRSAAALNIDAVLLTSDCTDPLYRRAARVSMGTVFQVPWTCFDYGSACHSDPCSGIASNDSSTHVNASSAHSNASGTRLDRPFDDKQFLHSISWPQPGIRFLHSLGFQTVAMALDDEAVSIDDPRLTTAEKLAIVLGTEGDGLSPQTIAQCDYKACIPMSHSVDSLNVAAASAVAFWELRPRVPVLRT